MKAQALPPPISVVIATLDRPEALRTCLRSLREQDWSGPLEIVVVDNNPTSCLTPTVTAEFPGVITVDEPRRGLAYARNKGFTTSTGDIVVATDDDITMPREWLRKLAAPFADPKVMAVTGNVLPRQLETPAQRLYEIYGGLGRGSVRQVADATWFRRFTLAVPTWKLGATANAAFRADIFSDPRIGLMDESLGPGMPSGVGEDTYLFYKILKAGHIIVYEPEAVVWHTHRREMADLKRQLFNYSKGHVAYNLTTFITDHDVRGLLQLLTILPAWHVLRIMRRMVGKSQYPISLVLLEVWGNLLGPWSLCKSRRRVKREGRSEPYVPVGSRTGRPIFDRITRT